MHESSHVARVTEGAAMTQGGNHPDGEPLDKDAARPPGAAAQEPAGPLDARDLAVLDRAFARRRGLARAVLLARTNGITLLLSAVLCLASSVLDPRLLLAVLVLGGCGLAEMRGARQLQKLDLRAPKWLVANQMVLLFAVALYCMAGIYSGFRAASPTSDLAREYPDMAAQLDNLAESLGTDESSALFNHAYRAAVVGFYLAVLGACALYQGACAYFYFKRADAIRAHLAQTPAWALEVQRRLLGW
jgi:hypothetical protein